MSDTSREKIYGVDSADPNTRLLRVKVLRATDLQRRDFLGGPGDPYVKILLQTRENRNQTIDIAVTKSLKKTLNPIWDQDFLFRVRKFTKLKDILFCCCHRLIKLNID